MEFIRYKTRNIKGGYLYIPENQQGPLPLVIWLTGGNDGAQLPLDFSLGKLLNEGKIQPDCLVLMPAATYGHNYTTMTVDELDKLILSAGILADIDYGNISICGWSLGADAAAILVAAAPKMFNRACIISNYPKALDKKPVDIPVLLLIGKKEKSASRDWLGILGRMPTASLLMAEDYGHEIGEKIWADEGAWLIRWLTGDGGGACCQTSR